MECGNPECKYVYAYKVSPHFCPQCHVDHNALPIVWIDNKSDNRKSQWYYVPLIRNPKEKLKPVYIYR